MRITMMALAVVGLASVIMARAEQRPKAGHRAATQTANTADTPASAPIRISVRFIDLQMDADGKGSLYIDCRNNSGTRITPSKGISSKLTLLEGAVVTELQDGRSEVFHDFTTFANIEDLLRETRNKEAFKLDKERRGLLLKPVEVPGHHAKAAEFWYPRAVRLPVALRMALADLEADPFCIELQFRQSKYAKLNVYIFNDPKKPLGVHVSWFDATKGSVVTLINSELPVDAEVTYGFKCPIDAEHQAPTPFFQRINGEMTIHELDVTAKFTARVGVRFVDRKGLVVVESVFEGPAAKVGVMPGDVVTRIDSKAIVNAEAAVRLIRDRNPGDTLQLTINREGKGLTIPVIAE